MAKDKKSFIAYCDWIEIFEALPNDKAGELIKHLLRYVNDQDPTTKDQFVNLAFIPLKQSLKRDLRKYESYIDKQRINGAKGGRPKNPKEPKEPKPLFENPEEPKKADSVSDSGNDSDTIIIYNSDELRNCFSMKENVAKLIGKPIEQVDKLLNLFIIEQEAKGEMNRSLSKLRIHFTSWAKLNHDRVKKTGISVSN